MFDRYVLPGDDIHPEGIVADPDGATFYVSSAKQGTIFRGRIDIERLEVWQPGGVDGRDHAVGMAVDERGRLLVCGYETGLLFGYDTRSGALVGRQRVPAEQSLLNDVCVAGGYAYVTDSSRPVLWRYELGETIGAPQEWLDLGNAEATPYLNGIVALHDGATLLVVAQGTEELWRVDIATRAAQRLDVRVAGDGMLMVGDILYVVDNLEPAPDVVDFYVSAFRLSADARAAELIERRPRAHADHPTTTALVGGRLLVVNSQFGAGQAGTVELPFTVSAFDL